MTKQSCDRNRNPSRKVRKRPWWKIRQAVGSELEHRLDILIESVLRHQGFAGDYLQRQYKAKYLDESIVPASVRSDNGIDKWLRVEEKNRKTNMRLFAHPEPNWRFSCHDRFIRRVQDIIRSVLGDVPCWRSQAEISVTNGASTRVRRSPIAAYEKLVGEMHISSSALPHFLETFSGTEWLRDDVEDPLSFRIQESSVLFTVPKSTEIDRVAAKEPEGNMVMQRIVGNYLRSRLRRVGVNLNDQTVNQRLAHRGVVDGLATIDLSSASDSITTQLVISLLPFEWYSLLDDLRVKTTVLPNGTSHQLEMFSSMGNGFTFELESLLFYAIAKAVCWVSGIRGRVAVYGDDIIIPVQAAPRLKRVFAWFGFVLNEKKSFWRGPFRESCGKHYYNSVDVTPFFLRKRVDTIPELINILNRLLEWDGRGWGFFTTKEAYEFWDYARQYVPKRLWGGITPDDPSALVTGDAPRKRLIPVTDAEGQAPDLGRYRYWHARRSSAPSSVLETEFDSLVVRAYRTVPVVSRGERTTWCPDIAFR